MYRLDGPKFFLFFPLILIGIFLVALSPHYLLQQRIISLSALFIGEMGLSFIPVIALFPKASFFQALTLASIYLSTNLLICFGAWGINTFGWPGQFSFDVKYGELHLNTYSLFIANLFAFAILISNFKLIYDEELTKQQRSIPRKKGVSLFAKFSKPTLSRPDFGEAAKASSKTPDKESLKPKQKGDSEFEEEFWKPFEFEPEINKAPEKLPEESSGSLFSGEENISRKEEGANIFDSETILEEPAIKPEKPKAIQISPLPPSNIKEELSAIFEQYSSLDAVKKLSSAKPGGTAKPKSEREKRKFASKEKPEISVNIEGQDIHNASFRHISEAETIEEIKETLKKEIEESHGDSQENIIESIRNIKDELIESLRTEIKKEITEEVKPLREKMEEVNEEEVFILQENISNLLEDKSISGASYIDRSGSVLTEEWLNEDSLGTSPEVLTQLATDLNQRINETNQGNLLHVLLESKDGIIVIANLEDKILAVKSRETNERYIGQLLTSISETEEN